VAVVGEDRHALEGGRGVDRVPRVLRRPARQLDRRERRPLADSVQPRHVVGSEPKEENGEVQVREE